MITISTMKNCALQKRGMNCNFTLLIITINNFFRASSDKMPLSIYSLSLIRVTRVPAYQRHVLSASQYSQSIGTQFMCAYNKDALSGFCLQQSSSEGTIATLIENSVNFFEYEKNSTDNIAMLRRVLLRVGFSYVFQAFYAGDPLQQWELSLGRDINVDLTEEGVNKLDLISC